METCYVVFSREGVKGFPSEGRNDEGLCFIGTEADELRWWLEQPSEDAALVEKLTEILGSPSSGVKLRRSAREATPPEAFQARADHYVYHVIRNDAPPERLNIIIQTLRQAGATFMTCQWSGEALVYDE